MNAAVFLDRDGTINIEESYLSDPNKLRLIDGTLESLKQLQDQGFLLFIVTNQSGIGRGYYSEADMHAVNDKLVRIAADAGIQFAKIYFAPEAPEAPSYGRKPSPQFLLDASRDFQVDLATAFMIGDKLSDLQCGWNAGIGKSILVKTGCGQALARRPDIDLSQTVIVEDLREATEYILKAERMRLKA
ncbi:MAG: D-glycero-alpha-D-manno-heptose-1,7-bisphosphate 7-phosphatase [Verrucomicrobia subdivision 3 bacterium]|nr:D-glycero-alpha-D-manno-heptose-1,7-bisphosphate 7-phosphatase [Limisphaerales bacterium]MCS1415653.1 D-glycero-alpha-D-manno-heptose-1,7-bisphosphate 7-phosphatase [Limisphaerales bacterium]